MPHLDLELLIMLAKPELHALIQNTKAQNWTAVASVTAKHPGREYTGKTPHDALCAMMRDQKAKGRVELELVA